MDVKGIVRERLMKQEQPPLVLKEAQIVQGKITKLFSGQKAQIQIGSHTLLAEVSAPLTVGERYFFQVQGTEDQIHLKVIGESLKQDAAQSVEMLMDKLSIRQTKINTAFIERLIQERIPFRQQQLSQAVALLDQAANKQQLMSILLEMMEQKLPLTAEAVQAMQMQKKADAGDLIDQLRHILQQSGSSETEKALLQKLDALHASPPVKGVAMLAYIQRNFSVETLLPLLKWTGHVQTDSTMAELLSFAKGNQVSSPSIWTNQTDALDAQQLKQIIEQLVKQEQSIRPQALQLSSIFHRAAAGSLTEEQMAQLQQAIQRNLLPHLPLEMRPAVENLIRTSNQPAIHEMLTFFARPAVYAQGMSTLLPSLEMMTMSQESGSMSEQFLSHVQRYMQTIGFGDEYQLRHHFQETLEQITQDRHQAQSVKMMLQQLVGQEQGTIREAAQPLLQLINGMQMQMIVETNNILQATIPIPGNKFALPKDMLMQFEGQKTSDGKISPDYCRILFMLELQHLQETMIDMHVQKRVISVTIYNDVIRSNTSIDTTLEAIMEQKLEALDYQLSAVTWKSFQDETSPESSGGKIQDEWPGQEERFDYRI